MRLAFLAANEGRRPYCNQSKHAVDHSCGDGKGGVGSFERLQHRLSRRVARTRCLGRVNDYLLLLARNGDFLLTTWTRPFLSRELVADAKPLMTTRTCNGYWHWASNQWNGSGKTATKEWLDEAVVLLPVWHSRSVWHSHWRRQ